MADKIILYVTIDDTLEVQATFDGTKVSRYFSDLYLSDSLEKSLERSEDNMGNLYDYAVSIFGALNQEVRRHYSGQELMLESVLVQGEYRSIEITR